MTSESGVNLIKKKVQSLKNELDESQTRANEAEEQLVEKESTIEKVWILILEIPCLQCFVRWLVRLFNFNLASIWWFLVHLSFLFCPYKVLSFIFVEAFKLNIFILLKQLLQIFLANITFEKDSLDLQVQIS